MIKIKWSSMPAFFFENSDCNSSSSFDICLLFIFSAISKASQKSQICYDLRNYLNQSSLAPIPFCRDYKECEQNSPEFFPVAWGYNFVCSTEDLWLKLEKSIRASLFVPRRESPDSVPSNCSLKFVAFLWSHTLCLVKISIKQTYKFITVVC